VGWPFPLIGPPQDALTPRYSLYFSLFQGITDRDRLARDWLHRQRHKSVHYFSQASSRLPDTHTIAAETRPVYCPAQSLVPGPREITTLRLGDSSGLVMEGGGNCFGDAHPIAAKGLRFLLGDLPPPPSSFLLIPIHLSFRLPPQVHLRIQLLPGMTSFHSYTSTITCYLHYKPLIC